MTDPVNLATWAGGPNLSVNIAVDASAPEEFNDLEDSQTADSKVLSSVLTSDAQPSQE